MSDHAPAPSPHPLPLPPPPPPPPVGAGPAAPVPAPAATNGPVFRSGDLTPGWRVVVGLTWLGVVFALAAVWTATVQLGLSTWWLGARAQPRARWVQFSVFVVPVMMLLATINRVRRLAWIGLVAAVLVAAVGLVDLVGRFESLGVLEVAIGVAAALVSMASLAGTYRPAR